MLDASKIYNSNNYGQFKILNYVNSRSVEIEFFDTGYKTITQVAHIRSGKVKDRLSPFVFGIGFMGDGKHKPTVNRKITKAYQTWHNMVERCYSDKCQAKHPTYIGCSVAIEWHNFQNFAQWFDENYIDGYDLDKDIKIDGNKIYSPENCIFVSTKENNIKANAKYYVFTSPKGETVNVYNLCEFCRENGLTQGNMCQVAKGKRNHHKQWTKTF